MSSQQHYGDVETASEAMPLLMCARAISRVHPAPKGPSERALHPCAMAHCHRDPLAGRRSGSKQSPGRAPGVGKRSEERRVGKECRSGRAPCRHEDTEIVKLDLEEAVAVEQRKDLLL